MYVSPGNDSRAEEGSNLQDIRVVTYLPRENGSDSEAIAANC